MRSEEIRTRGTALAERVHRQVDTRARFQLLVGQRRRGRILGYALAAAALAAVVLGVAFLLTIEDAPVASQPPPTSSAPVTELRPLPVELFVVLLREYTVDEATGECSGSGILSDLLEGSNVLLVDEVSGAELGSLPLPFGTEVVRGDDPLFLLPSDEDAGCVFSLGDPGLDNFDVRFESDPDVGMSGTRSGQRVVVRLDPSG